MQKSALENVNPTLRYEFLNFATFLTIFAVFSFFLVFLAKVAKFKNSDLSVGLTFSNADFYNVVRMMSGTEKKLLFFPTP